jgi:purine-binding chemotaxis protein CheW
MVETRQLCTFWLDHLYLGVDVRDVQGVVSHQPLTRVPLAPPAVRGLMNVRGEVIAGIDLRPCLGLDAGNEECLWTNIVLNGSSGPVSLLADAIGDVVAVAEGQLEPPPETLPAKLREITESVCRQDGKLLLLLDVESVILLASGTEVEF